MSRISSAFYLKKQLREKPLDITEKLQIIIGDLPEDEDVPHAREMAQLGTGMTAEEEKELKVMMSTKGEVVKPDFREVEDYMKSTSPTFTARTYHTDYIVDPLIVYAGHAEYEADKDDLNWLESYSKSKAPTQPSISIHDLEELFTQWEFFLLIDKDVPISLESAVKYAAFSNLRSIAPIVYPYWSSKRTKRNGLMLPKLLNPEELEDYFERERERKRNDSRHKRGPNNGLEESPRLDDGKSKLRDSQVLEFDSAAKSSPTRGGELRQSGGTPRNVGAPPSNDVSVNNSTNTNVPTGGKGLLSPQKAPPSDNNGASNPGPVRSKNVQSEAESEAPTIQKKSLSKKRSTQEQKKIKMREIKNNVTSYNDLAMLWRQFSAARRMLGLIKRREELKLEELQSWNKRLRLIEQLTSDEVRMIDEPTSVSSGRVSEDNGIMEDDTVNQFGNDEGFDDFQQTVHEEQLPLTVPDLNDDDEPYPPRLLFDPDKPVSKKKEKARAKELIPSQLEEADPFLSENFSLIGGPMKQEKRSHKKKISGSSGNQKVQKKKEPQGLRSKNMMLLDDSDGDFPNYDDVDEDYGGVSRAGGEASDEEGSSESESSEESEEEATFAMQKKKPPQPSLKRKRTGDLSEESEPKKPLKRQRTSSLRDLQVPLVTPVSASGTKRSTGGIKKPNIELLPPESAPSDQPKKLVVKLKLSQSVAKSASLQVGSTSSAVKMPQAAASRKKKPPNKQRVRKPASASWLNYVEIEDEIDQITLPSFGPSPGVDRVPLPVPILRKYFGFRDPSYAVLERNPDGSYTAHPLSAESNQFPNMDNSEDRIVVRRMLGPSGEEYLEQLEPNFDRVNRARFLDDYENDYALLSDDFDVKAESDENDSMDNESSDFNLDSSDDDETAPPMTGLDAMDIDEPPSTLRAHLPKKVKPPSFNAVSNRKKPQWEFPNAELFRGTASSSTIPSQGRLVLVPLAPSPVPSSENTNGLQESTRIIARSWKL